ncbi:MAG: PD-(D/E)XK nuclease family protein [Pirellulaceae bacterium]|nr:PD-(D/E)XK nuclease family protein [Pirellulaceae bacterium]
MNNQRHIYLGWDAPPIDSLTNWLTAHHTHNNDLDLSETIIVLPAATAVKSLLKRLIEHCQTQGLLFFPPTAVTLGRLPEYLYKAKPTASESLQAMLWAEVARKAAINNALHHVFPTPPHLDHFAPWYAIGETLATLHTELAGDLQNFESVVKYCEESGHSDEVERWQQLQALQQSYHTELDRLGFWDIQTARMIAVEKSECTTNKDIIVAGCVDINRTMQGMLNDVSDSLTVLTFAPESESNRFQQNGALNVAAWHEQPIDISMNQLTMVESPNAQALACANAIAEQSAMGAMQHDFVIACPDANDESYIVRLFDRQSTPVSQLHGRSLNDNIVIATLRLLSNFVESGSYQSFSSLLRLPDIQQYLIDAGITDDVISMSDDFHETHLPRHLDRLRGVIGKFENLAAALQTLDDLVLPLSSGSARISRWCAVILEVLNSIYGHRLVEKNHPPDCAVLCGTRAIAQSLSQLADADDSVLMECTVTECIDLALGLASTQFETIQASRGVAIIGWLDVVWGEQSHVLVTGFNDGTIPSSITSDLFLPNSLRTSLGLVDNDRRFARDAYTTTLLVHSRTTVTFFCKKTDAAGMPLWPSRIALTGDPQQVAERLSDFSNVGSKTTSISPVYVVSSNPAAPLEIEFAKIGKTEFTVTEFKDYLNCPTRYYLRHILRIRSVSDNSHELSAFAFGNLLHDTLNDFGLSDLRRSSDSDAIYRYLESRVQTRGETLYGEYSYGVIQVQLAQLNDRLRAFSNWQAAWIADGWEIIESEYNCSSVPLSVDHPNLRIRGRIDRIDYHAETSRWAIFDYKSSEACDRPEKIHNCNDVPYWKDLQLPLYRHLAKSITGTTKVDLGYINICNDLKTIGEYLAKWDHDQLESADLVALNVMQAINANQFELRNDTKSNFFSDFAYLLGDTALDKPAHFIESEVIE